MSNIIGLSQKHLLPVKNRHLTSQMRQAAEILDFETAAKIRDQIKELRI